MGRKVAGKKWERKGGERIGELWWRGKERKEMKGGGKGRRKDRGFMVEREGKGGD